MLLCLLCAGCAGSHVLNNPSDIELNHPLAVADDGQLSAHLAWVVVKDGPGTWASNAFWDEYLIEVGNVSGGELSVVQVHVVDSLGNTHVPGESRDTLLYASKLSAKRYADQELDVVPGAGTLGMVATGVAGGVAAVTVVTVGGVAVGASAAGLSTSLTLAPVAAAAIYAVPVLIVGGAVHSVNNSEVSDEIEQRRTPMPVVLMPGERTEVRVFVPIAPSPRAVRLIYRVGDQAELLEIDTSEVLAGLHFADPNAQTRRPQEGSL